jgi:hypothetical protein
MSSSHCKGSTTGHVEKAEDPELGSQDRHPERAFQPRQRGEQRRRRCSGQKQTQGPGPLKASPRPAATTARRWSNQGL